MPFPYPLEHPLISESLVFAHGNEIVATRGAVQAWSDESNNRKNSKSALFNATKFVVQVHNRGDNSKLTTWDKPISCLVNWKHKPAENFDILSVDFAPSNTIEALSVIELTLKKI